MGRYKQLTKEQWLEYGEKAKELKRLLHEMKNMHVPVKIREPYLITAWRSIFRFCCAVEREMLKQHPDIKDPYRVFRGGIYNWD